MSLSPQFLDELRSRTSLSALVGKTVKLQKAGREWKACCPFHKEKTPSFTLSDEKGFYHCLAAETLVITPSGRVPIRDLAGKSVQVLSRGGQWIAAPIRSYGEQRLWRIDLSRNRQRKQVHATSGHRWFVNGRRSEVTTEALRSGMCLESAFPAKRDSWELDPEGVRHGIVFGDGTLYKGRYGTINLHGRKDAELADWFPVQVHHEHIRDGDKPYLRIYGGRDFGHMKALPNADCSDAYKLGFLAGYFAADGHVAKDGTVILNAAKGEVLEAIRDIAAALGIGTYGRTTQHRMGLGHSISAIHRIHFLGSTLAPEFFLLSEARDRFAASTKRFERLRWQVVSAEPTDRVEEVYCAEVPVEHAFTIEDNILTGNCFGCSAHGDAIRWLTDARGLPFMEAVKELADAAGMEVPAADPKAQEKAERAVGLYDVMEAAQTWFVEQLGSIEGGEARNYLEQRGIRETTIRKFGFGFAPDSRGKLKSALARFGNDKLVETGLLIAPEGGEREPYDRFRGRLMIPIRDQRGRVIAFGGRILGSGEPKYLNSPETPLFDKGRTLYNIDKAGPASRKSNRLIVVEGYMDVIALDQAGIGEAVAPLGTALTETQLERLWRLVPSPLLCFDGDSAGQKAGVRAALRALPQVGPGRSLAFVALPAGQDPDDLVRSEGRGALEALLESPQPLVDRLWNHEVVAEPLDTPEQRAGLKRRLLDHAATISDADVRDLYKSEWLARFSALTRPAAPPPWQPRTPQRNGQRGSQRGFQRGGRFQMAPRPTSESARAVGRGSLSAETTRAVLAGLLLHPELIAEHAEGVAALSLHDREAARLRDCLLDAAMSHGELDQQRLNTILAASGAAPFAEKLRQTRGLGFSFTRRDAEPERARRDLVLVIDTLAAQPGLNAALEAATSRLKEIGDEAAFQEQQRLRAARDEADQQLASLMESGAG